MSTSISSTEARQNWAEVLNRAAYSRERFAIERHGETVAALVSAEDLDVIQEVSDRAAAAEALDSLEETKATAKDPLSSQSPQKAHSPKDAPSLDEAIEGVVEALRHQEQDPRVLMWTVVQRIANRLGQDFLSPLGTSTPQPQKKTPGPFPGKS